MSNKGHTAQIKAVKQPPKAKRQSLNSFLDQNMKVTYRGGNSPKRHKIASKYITYENVTQEEWSRIFGGE